MALNIIQKMSVSNSNLIGGSTSVQLLFVDGYAPPEWQAHGIDFDCT